MAASDSCVPNLYADPSESRATERESSYSGFVRSFASAAVASADVLVTGIFTFVVCSLSSGSLLSLRQRIMMSVVMGIAAAFSQSQQSQFSICNLIQIRETAAILRSVVLLLFILLGMNLLLGRHLPATRYALFVAVLASSMFVVRELVTRLLRRIHRAGYGADDVVIYGHPDTTKQVAAAILRSPSCGLHPVALLHDDSLRPVGSMFRTKDGFCESIPVSSGPLTSAKLNALQYDLMILAAPYLSQNEIATKTDIAQQGGAPVAVLSSARESQDLFDQIEVDGQHLLTGMRTVPAWHSDLLKRAMDTTIALLLVVLGSPIFLFIAICIKLDSRGPVLFRQKRVGRNGELFNIFKFRSMYAGCAMYEASPIEPTDPRITRVGRILRQTGLDETAQLLNVLMGNMSLVGPRPEMPFLVERHVQQHRPRLQAIPGITGLWQLSTDRAFPIHQNTHYDLFYIRNRTCWMDAAILLHTVLFAMRGGV